ncbi:folylpolyglutamate synthase, mitochondrial isoform X3 [Anopheles gambiae]|uniref:folylpolyglutamate synthase, mitochondrial isoform X3 n=1 Tax=Anopheles gambiae TaxID=7165 RepID=UPI002AC94C51|nr:folylpolyglutamate synthase, mitochondrial isoform X3 [Anopheles gambiae]
MFRIADFTVRWRKMMNKFTCETASISLLHVSSVKSHLLSTMKGSNVASTLDESYENAISSLNSLQSNSSVLQDSILRKHSEDNKHINDTLKYLLRIGVSMDHLNQLPVIHVSGTKGKANLFVVPSELKAYQWAKKPELVNESCDILDILELNTSLAIQIATNWMNKNISEISQENITSIVTKQTVEGIDRCFWPGRLQRILYDTKKTLYLDGAHTLESIHLCARWYNMKSHSQYKRLLIFNTTGDRDSAKLLSTLSSMIKFDAAFFTPSVPRDTVTCVDAMNHNFPFELQLQRCRQNYEYWSQTIQHKEGFLHESIESVFKQIDEDFVFKGETCDILITGSIHLIGAAFVALNLERFMCTSTTQ